MAKKKPTSRTDAVRQAVDQAFQTQIPRERIGELLDELGHTAGRLRGAVDDLRPASAEDVKTLRADLEALVARVDGARGRGRGEAQARAAKPRRGEAGRARQRSAKTRGERRQARREAAQACRREAQARRRGLLMGVEFDSPREFREVMDRVFTLMSEDPDMGPKLRDADVPQRFEFEDLDLIVNIRAARDGEDGCLHWEWSDDVDWKSKVQMKMSAETANKYFQGKENVPRRDRAAPDQDGRRHQGRARAHPDHEARLRAVPGRHRGRVPAPARVAHARARAWTLRRVDTARREAYSYGHQVEQWVAVHPQGAAGTKTSAVDRGSGPRRPQTAEPRLRRRHVKVWCTASTLLPSGSSTNAP